MWEAIPFRLRVAHMYGTSKGMLNSSQGLDLAVSADDLSGMDTMNVQQLT